VKQRDCTEWERDFIATVIPDIATCRAHETIVNARVLWDALLLRVQSTLDDEESSVCADEMYHRIGVNGCKTRIESERKRYHKNITVIDTDGHKQRVINQSMRATKKRHAEADGGGVYWQVAMWIEFTYDEVMDFWTSLQAAARAGAIKLAAFEQVVDAYEEYPQAKNAGEACRLAGIDPADIEITDDDIRRVMGA
jgi:hypothetical protein